MPKLRWAHGFYAGVDVIADFAREDLAHVGVPLSNGRGAFSSSLAEWAICSAMHFIKQIPRCMQNRREKKWDKCAWRPSLPTLPAVTHANVQPLCSRLMLPYVCELRSRDGRAAWAHPRARRIWRHCHGDSTAGQGFWDACGRTQAQCAQARPFGLHRSHARPVRRAGAAGAQEGSLRAVRRRRLHAARVSSGAHTLPFQALSLCRCHCSWSRALCVALSALPRHAILWARPSLRRCRRVPSSSLWDVRALRPPRPLIALRRRRHHDPRTHTRLGAVVLSTRDAAASPGVPAPIVVHRVLAWRTGGVAVNEAALDDALRGGRLGGVALDVFEAEPLPPDSPLWDPIHGERLLLTAHNADFTEAYFQLGWDVWRKNLDAFQSGSPLVTPVDAKAGY